MNKKVGFVEWAHWKQMTGSEVRHIAVPYAAVSLAQSRPRLLSNDYSIEAGALVW